LITAKNKLENTEKIFACYDTQITVPASKSLQEK